MAILPETTPGGPGDPVYLDQSGNLPAINGANLTGLLPHNVMDVTPTLGQTVFTLPTAPTDPALVFIVLNHAMYHSPASFTVAGTTITWTSSIVLDGGDRIRVFY